MVAGLADVTNELDLEGKLREALEGKRRAEEDLWDFTQNAVEGLHALGPDGTVLWANQAQLNLLGFPAEDYIGRPAADFHVEPEVVSEILAG
jgi:PAS domain-containing protein